jgi:hypothetical protein
VVFVKVHSLEPGRQRGRSVENHGSGDRGIAWRVRKTVRNQCPRIQRDGCCGEAGTLDTTVLSVSPVTAGA